MAKGRRFRSVNWDSRDSVETTDQEAVSIMHGKALNVEDLGKDGWKGEIQVRGRGIGRHSKINLSIETKNGIEATHTMVEVVDKERQPQASIQIDIVPEPGGQARAAWDRENPNRLKVYAGHTSLVRYLGHEEDGYPGQNLPHSKILLAEIVVEKVVQRILEKKMESNPRYFEDPNALFFRYSEELTMFLPIAHRAMISDSDAKKLLGNGDGFGHSNSLPNSRLVGKDKMPSLDRLAFNGES